MIVNVAPEEPPPGPSVNTVTLTILAVGLVLGGIGGVAVKISDAGIVAVSCVELTNVVAFWLPSHFTTEQGTKLLPVTVSVNVGEPAVVLVDDSEILPGEGRVARGEGVVIVMASVLDVPEAFDTETPAGPGNAASWGKIEAVSWPELMNAVARCEPFQFTFDPLSKFEPATVSVNPVGLQYGVEDGEVEVTVGNGPGVGLIVKFTTFDCSVVVVAVVPEAPETAEPGIWTATRMVSAAVMSEAGTVAVSCVLVMEVGVSWTWFGPTFHKTAARGTNPAPFAVIVKLWSPAFAVWGLRYASTEEDV